MSQRTQWLLETKDLIQSRRFWLCVAAYGLGLAIAVLIRGDAKGSDLVAFSGAVFGAGASIWGALLVVDHQRRSARQQSIEAIGDALEALYGALEPFAAERVLEHSLASNLIMHVERDEAIRRIVVVMQLNAKIVDRGLDVGARFLLRLLDIQAILNEADWSEPDILVSETNSKGTTYRLGSQQKTTLAQILMRQISDALREIKRPTPIFARANLMEEADTAG